MTYLLWHAVYIRLYLELFSSIDSIVCIPTGMGLCGSTATPEEQSEKERSKQLEKQNRAAANADAQIYKLLLLGAGESGKSTLFKQMITIYGKGFPEEERKFFEPIIYNNIITSMQTLLAAVADNAPNHGGQVSCPDSFEYVNEMPGDEEINQGNVQHFVDLWADSAVQEAYSNRSNFQLTDSADYFFNKIAEVAVDDYLPSEQDVLRSRVRTTGIVENAFVIDDNNFKMYDVGGQRNERKKWIHCFENVTAVLFVGVLSEYDLVLYEDNTMNRMEETLNLFEEICNSRWFRDTSLIFFLNKRDLFEQKITKVPLTTCPLFSDYEGDPHDYEGCSKAISKLFHSKNKVPDKQIYTHIVCATDTGNISKVFNAVKDIVMRKSLGEAGLI